MSATLPHDDDIQGLIARCRRNDQRAWNALVERYHKVVYSFAHRAGVRGADAEDVFQNVFLKVFESLDRLRDDSRFGSWLITVTLREAWRVQARARAAKQMGQELAAVRAPDAGRHASPLAEASELELRRLVDHALMALSPEERRVVHGLFFDSTHPAYATVAAGAGRSIGSIGPTRQRCLRKLAGRLPVSLAR